MARKINFLDTPSQGTLGEESYVPSKKGLFSVLGDVLVKTSVGLNSASDLAQINQREFEAQQQIDQFISNYRMQNQSRKEEKAQQALENFYKERQLGLTPDSGGGLVGPRGLVGPNGKIYSIDPQTELKNKLELEKTISDIKENNFKSEMFNKIIGGEGGIKNVPPGTTFNAGGFNIPLNPEPTADMKNAAVGASQARILWDELKNQSEGLKGGYAGMGEMGKAFLNRGEGESANYQLYTDSLPSSAVSLYRALTGDTRLSDADAKARALPLLWEPSQSTSLREKKNAFIDKMIQSREALLATGKYKDGIIPLQDIKKEAQKSNESEDKYQRYLQLIGEK